MAMAFAATIYSKRRKFLVTPPFLCGFVTELFMLRVLCTSVKLQPFEAVRDGHSDAETLRK
jgi:hypothetical protein